MQDAQEEIIDCHYHPALDAATDFNWFHPSGTVIQQVETLKRAGVTRACGAPVLWFKEPCTSFAPICRLNDQALALRDRFPDFYVPGIQVHPHFPDESCREIERCCGGEGVRWIGELVGYIMGYGAEYDTLPALSIFREAARYNAVVNVHCDALNVIESVCRQVLEVNFVLAHPGGGKDEVLSRLDVLCRHPNLHFDLSGSGIDRYGLVSHIVRTAGVERLLFGTDYPINNPAVYVQGVKFETLAPAARAAVFAGNFRRLTGGV